MSRYQRTMGLVAIVTSMTLSGCFANPMPKDIIGKSDPDPEPFGLVEAMCTSGEPTKVFDLYNPHHTLYLERGFKYCHLDFKVDNDMFCEVQIPVKDPYDEHRIVKDSVIGSRSEEGVDLSLPLGQYDLSENYISVSCAPASNPFENIDDQSSIPFEIKPISEGSRPNPEKFRVDNKFIAVTASEGLAGIESLYNVASAYLNREDPDEYDLRNAILFPGATEILVSDVDPTKIEEIRFLDRSNRKTISIKISEGQLGPLTVISFANRNAKGDRRETGPSIAQIRDARKSPAKGYGISGKVPLFNSST